MKALVIRLIFLIGLFPIYSYSNPPSAMSPTVLNIPDGPGSISGLGESFSQSTYSGMGTYAYSFILPPALGGLTPRLGLVYNSGFGANEFGMGFRLNIPFIKRGTEKGLPVYTDSDLFITHNGGELVKLGGDKYRVELEESALIFEKQESGWISRDELGNKYYYGLSDGSKFYGAGGVYQWNLEKYEDVNGNEVSYKYKAVDSSQKKVLENMTYSSTGSSTISINLDYILSESPTVDYKSGAKQLASYLADKLSIYIGEKLVKVYRFNFKVRSDWSNLSLLSEISLYSDSSTLLTSVEITYSEFLEDQVANTAIPIKWNTGFYNTDTQFVDVNNDSLPDLIETLPSQDRVHINRFRSDETWEEPVLMSYSDTGKISDTNIEWADVDGDANVDLVKGLGANLYYYTLDEEGRKWSEFNTISNVALKPGDTGVALFDVNNDRLIDIVKLKGTTYVAQLNSLDGLGDYKSIPGISSFCICDADSYLSDMNGDGLQDLVSLKDGTLYYYPSKGLYGYDAAVVYSTPPRVYSTGSFKLVDMNGDGLSDVTFITSNYVQVWINKGLSSSLGGVISNYTVMPKPSNYSSVDRVELVDMNGNGSIDIVWYSASKGTNAFSYTEIFPNEQPNQLKTITNGIGGKTTLHYTSIVDEMIRDREAGNPWDHGVPVAMQVVKKIEVEDGISDTTQVTTFDYDNGYYHAEEKEFRGFEFSTQTQVGDNKQKSLVTTNEYHLGKDKEVLKGLPKKTEVKDISGKIFTSETNTWHAKKVAEGINEDDKDVYFAELQSVERIIKEKGQGSEVTLNWNYEYDDYGNATKIVEHGRAENGWQDERITENTFSASNSASLNNWMLSFPIQTLIKDGFGNVISKEQWFYDDESFAGSNLGYVTKGNLTLHRKWITPSDNSSFINLARNKYDDYGNVTDIYGPLWSSGSAGHHTKIEYDPIFNTYPVKETIYTGGETLIAHASYNYDYGTMSSFTDFNGIQTTFYYDGFGRLKDVVKPGDSKDLPTVHYDYVINHKLDNGTVNYIETQQREKSGQSGVVVSRSYYDGLGRLLNNVSEGSLSGEFVVSGHTTYGKRGLPNLTYQPFKANSINFIPEAKANTGYIENTYDELGRVLKTYTSYADNNSRAYSEIVYEPLVQRIYDHEQTNTTSKHYGSYKQLTFDGLLNDKGQGRLVQVDELVALTQHGEDAGSAITWSTHYEYDVLGNFTRLKDAQNNERIMRYDGLSRNYFYNDPNRGYFWTAFDAASNILATRDANGNEVHNKYDGANRLLNEYHITPAITEARIDEIWSPNFNAQGLHPVTTFSYDKINGVPSGNSLGRLVKVEDKAGYSQYKFDIRGRVIEQSRQITGHGIHSSVYTSKRQYDAMNRLQQYEYADGTYLTYGYDNRGLLNSLSGVIDDIQYDAAGNQTLRSYLNDVDVHYTYDHQLRLNSLTATRLIDSVDLQNYSYEFDELTNIKSITDHRNSSTLVSIASEIDLASAQAQELKQTFAYQYDDLYRLAEAKSELATYQYRYDMIGNLQARTTITHEGSRISQLRYGNSQSNDNMGSSFRVGRMQQEVPGPHAMTSMNGNDRYWYDSNGNLIQDGDLYYQWDHRNRLIQVSTQAPVNP